MTNAGTAELKITHVKTNCGCTVAGDDPRVFGESSSSQEKNASAD